MQIKNIEHGLRSTMVAVFKKQGLSDAAANAKALKHLRSARSMFDKAREQPEPVTRPTGRELILRDIRSIQPVSKSVPSERKRGPSIKAASKKIASGEQMALRRVMAPSRVKDLIASKSGIGVAAALGAVAKWAKTLP
jgi:hypothetical protein